MRHVVRLKVSFISSFIFSICSSIFKRVYVHSINWEGKTTYKNTGFSTNSGYKMLSLANTAPYDKTLPTAPASRVATLLSTHHAPTTEDLSVP